MAMEAQSTLSVRPMLAADITAIVALESEAFSPPWSRALLERALANDRGVAIVAVLGEEVVGYALGWTMGEEGELDRIAVEGTRRGQGIGARLLVEWLWRCRTRAVKVLFLEVREGNYAAQRLYRKCGFVPVGRRPHYYDDGEAALILRLESDKH